MLSVRENKLAEKYSEEILRTYEENSSVTRLASPLKEKDLEAPGFVKIAKKFLISRESFELNRFLIVRPFAEFIELSEFQYLINVLKKTARKPKFASHKPDENLINASLKTISRFTQPNYIIIPVAFYVSLHMQKGSRGLPLIDYDNSKSYYVGDETRLEILWSNKHIKLNQIIIGNNRDSQWLYKSDGKERLRVKFELDEPPNLSLLVETIFRYLPPPPDKIAVIDFPEKLCNFS